MYTSEEKKRILRNTLSQISNALYAVLHKQDSWDNRIKTMQEISKLIPLVIRLMIWFKNVGEQ